MKKQCEICGKSFKAPTAQYKTCGKKCQRKQHNKRTEEYRKRNKEKCRELSLLHYYKNRELYLKKNKKHKEDHKEHYKKWRKEYYKKTKERLKEWQKKNPISHRNACRRYYAKNKEKESERLKKYHLIMRYGPDCDPEILKLFRTFKDNLKAFKKEVKENAY